MEGLLPDYLQAEVEREKANKTQTNFDTGSKELNEKDEMQRTGQLPQPAMLMSIQPKMAIPAMATPTTTVILDAVVVGPAYMS